MAEQQYIYVATPAVVASPASYAGYTGYAQTTETAYVQPNYTFEQSASGTTYAIPSYQYEVQPATHYAAQSTGIAMAGASNQQQVLAEYPVAAAGQQIYSTLQTVSYQQVGTQQNAGAYTQQQTVYNTGHVAATTMPQAAYTPQQQQYGVAVAYQQSPQTGISQQATQLTQYTLQNQQITPQQQLGQQQQVGQQQQLLQTPTYAGTQLVAQQANIAYGQQAIMPGQTTLYQQQQQPTYSQQQQVPHLTLPQPQQQQQSYTQQQQNLQQHVMMPGPNQQQNQQFVLPGQQQHNIRPLTFPGPSLQSNSNSIMKLGSQRNSQSSFSSMPSGNVGNSSASQDTAPTMPAPQPITTMVGDVEIQKFPDTIFIQGLPDDTTESMLVQHFSSVGKLKVDLRTGKPKVSLVKDKSTGRPRGEATIGYRDVASVDNAIRLFNNKAFRGRKIRVEVACRKVTQNQQQLQATKRSRPEEAQDWVCVNTLCNNQNFSWRLECNRCKAPKPANPQLKPPIGLRMASPAPNNSGISMPTKNNPFTPNNPLIRPPLLGNGILPGANPLTHPMLQHSANNLLGLRGPNFPGQSLRGRLGIGPLAAAMSGVANINGGPIRPAIRGRMDRRMGRPY